MTIARTWNTLLTVLLSALCRDRVHDSYEPNENITDITKLGAQVGDRGPAGLFSFDHRPSLSYSKVRAAGAKLWCHYGDWKFR